MTDLSQIINQSVTAKLSAEFVQKQVDERVDKLVRDAIDSALSTYSDTGKLIKAAVKDALRVNRLDLPSYGATITQMLASKVEELVSEQIAGRLTEDMRELLALAPKTIKLSEIAKAMLERHDDKYGEVITVIVHRNEYDSIWLHLDEAAHYEDRDRHKARCCILLGKDGTIFSGTLSGREIKATQTFGKHVHIGPSGYGLELDLLSYYACGTVIEIDEDAVVTSVGDY